MADTTRREMLATAIAVLPAADGLLHVTVDEIAANPPLPPDPKPPEPPDNVVVRNLGAIDGHAPFSYLDAGDDAYYDYSGTVRTTHLKDSVWQGTRSLYLIDGGKLPDGTPKQSNPDHRGAHIFGGAWICPDMASTRPDWDKCYQSRNSPTAAITFRECSLWNLSIEAVRVHGGFDGLQNGSGTKDRCSDLTVAWSAFTGMRDDAIENDNRWDDHVIDRNLCEAFVFFSSRNNDKYDGSRFTNYFSGNVVMLPQMMFEMQMEVGLAFKLDGRAPRLVLEDNIFGADGRPQKNTNGVFYDLLRYKKAGTIRGNIFCWLGEGRNPHTLPSIGFEVLEGDEARQCLAKATADFWRSYQGHRFDFDPPAEAA